MGTEYQMKKILSIFFLMLFAVAAFAQDDVDEDRNFFSDGFGCGSLKFSRVKDKLGLFIGGRGGLVINQTYTLAVGGYLLVNNISAPPPDDDLFLNMAYAGIDGGYLYYPADRVYFNISALIGIGVSTLRDDEFNDITHEDLFFVFEPSARIMIHMVHSVWFGLGGSYRYISGITEHGLDSASLGGLSVSIHFEFGHF